jgi:hypothetical protein
MATIYKQQTTSLKRPRVLPLDELGTGDNSPNSSHFGFECIDTPDSVSVVVGPGKKTYEISDALIEILGPWLLNPEHKRRFKQGTKHLPLVNTSVFLWIRSCAESKMLAIDSELSVPLPRDLWDREDFVKAQLRYLQLNHLWVHVLRQKLRAAGCLRDAKCLPHKLPGKKKKKGLTEWVSQEDMQEFQQDLLTRSRVAKCIPGLCEVNLHLRAHNVSSWDDFRYFANDILSLNIQKQTQAEQQYLKLFKCMPGSITCRHHEIVPLKDIMQLKSMLCIVLLNVYI